MLIPLLCLPLLLAQDPAPQAAASPVSVAVTLLDESGAVPEGLSVRVHAYLGEEVVGGFFVVPENGRLRLDLPPQLQRFPCSRIAVAPGEQGATTADWSRAAVVDLPAEQAGLELDLGEVRLSSAPVLFSGRVVDDGGEPVVGARVSVDAEKRNDGSEARLYETLLIDCLTDDQGRFLVRGRPGWTPQEEALRIGAAADGYQEAEQQVVEGPREDLELVLQRAGSVTVSWILPQGAERATLGMQFAPMEEDPASVTIFDWPRPERVMPKVAPGVYRLRLLDHGGNVVHEVEGIEVHPGEACADERVRDIDLRDRVRVVRLTVTEESGRVPQVPFQVWSVAERDNRVPRAGWRGSNRDEWLLLVGVDESADVYVSARGYRPQVVEDVDADTVVRLQRTLDLTLEIVGTEVFEKDGRYLGMLVLPYPLPEAPGIIRPGHSVELFGAGPVRSRTVTARMPGPGEYLVRWNVYEQGPDGRPRILGSVDGDLIEVTDELDLQTVETPLPPEVWTVGDSE